MKWHALKPHSHAPNIPENDAQAVLHTYRDLARKNPDKPAKRAFEEVLATRGSTGINPSSDDCLKYLGNFTNHKNMYYRIREGNRPKLPKTVDDVGVEVLADLGQCLNGGEFYLCTTATKSCVFFSDTQIAISDHSSSTILCPGCIRCRNLLVCAMLVLKTFSPDYT